MTWKYKHGPVIDQRLITEVDLQLREIKHKTKKERKRTYLLTGVLMCKDSSTFYGEPAKSGMNLYYTNKKNGLRFPTSVLDHLVIKRVKEYLFDSHTVSQIFEKALNDKNSVLGYVLDRIRESSSIVEDIENKLENLSKSLMELVAVGKSSSDTAEWLGEEQGKLKTKHQHELKILEQLKIQESYVRGQFQNQTVATYLKKGIKSIDSLDIKELKTIVHRLIKNIIIDPYDLSIIDIQLRPDPMGFRKTRPITTGEKVRNRGGSGGTRER